MYRTEMGYDDKALGASATLPRCDHAYWTYRQGISANKAVYSHMLSAQRQLWLDVDESLCCSALWWWRSEVEMLVGWACQI